MSIVLIDYRHVHADRLLDGWTDGQTYTLQRQLTNITDWTLNSVTGDKSKTAENHKTMLLFIFIAWVSCINVMLINIIFSERELTYMLSPVCLSVVCNVGEPYSAGWNFLQFFFAVWYLGHPLTYRKNFTEIVPGEPLRRGFKRKRVAIFDIWNVVSPKQCKIGGKFVLINNRKSY